MNESIRNTIEKAHLTNSMILPDGSLVSLDTHATRLNNNVLIIGGSGSGKSRSYVIPNILAMNGSYIISDPKGTLRRQWSRQLKKHDYKVISIDLIHPEKSDHYDPVHYLRNSDDAMTLAHWIVYANTSACYTGDPFWNQASELLLSSILGYMIENRDNSELFRFSGILSMLNKLDPNAWENEEKSEFDLLFERHGNRLSKENGDPGWAYSQYKRFCQCPRKTLACILLTLQGNLSTFNTPSLHQMMNGKTIDFTRIGTEKTVVFIEISDTDRSKDIIANLFFTQAMNRLCSFADEKCPEGRLPVPVRFFLDDFSTNCRIVGFENMISNIRARDISAAVVIQSVSQLESGYGKSAHTIIDNCDTMIYMGGNDPDTAGQISIRCNKPLSTVLNMELGMHWSIRRGSTPHLSCTKDLSCYKICENDKN